MKLMPEEKCLPAGWDSDSHPLKSFVGPSDCPSVMGPSSFCKGGRAWKWAAGLTMIFPCQPTGCPHATQPT